MLARRGTKMLAPPSRDTAVGRAQPTPAAADRRNGLGEDSTAKTNPFRAVEASGRGSRSSFQGMPETSAPPSISARPIMSITVWAIAAEGASKLRHASAPSPRTFIAAARVQGGQAPLTPLTGAPYPPPGCGLATTLPRPAGNAWPVAVAMKATAATARARGGQAPLAPTEGAPCPPPHCSRATALSLPTSSAWLIGPTT